MFQYVLLVMRVGYCTICIQLSCGKLILLRLNQNALSKLSLLMYSKHQDQGKFICTCIFKRRDHGGSKYTGAAAGILSYTSVGNWVEKSVNSSTIMPLRVFSSVYKPRDNKRKSLLRIRIILVFYYNKLTNIRVAKCKCMCRVCVRVSGDPTQ